MNVTGVKDAVRTETIVTNRKTKAGVSMGPPMVLLIPIPGKQPEESKNARVKKKKSIFRKKQDSLSK